MLHNDFYETIMLFLTGVGLGGYLFELRLIYRRSHPPTTDRSSRRQFNERWDTSTDPFGAAGGILKTPLK